MKRFLSRNGKEALPRQRGDTVLLDPGNWMLHCHVLEHQATGMTAIVRVM